eukprot:6210756-Pleurochrysis_carterae.AAC.1
MFWSISTYTFGGRASFPAWLAKDCISSLSSKSAAQRTPARATAGTGGRHLLVKLYVGAADFQVEYTPLELAAALKCCIPMMRESVTDAWSSSESPSI